jgi:membrane fusion protein, copper/silver efflux system
MKKRHIVIVVIAVSAALASGYWIGRRGPMGVAGAGQTPDASLYHCPMHPQYTSDKPGDCPICGMRLVAVSREEHAGHEEPFGASVPGQAPVRIAPGREQLIGVRTAPVKTRELTAVVRAAGRVAQDPDLYNAIAEYKEAARARAASDGATDARERYEELVRAASLRLRRMGLSEDQIEVLARAQEPTNLLFGQPGENAWVYAQIYEYEAGLVRAGQSMEVDSPALPGRLLRGKVAAVDTVLDPRTRTLRVRGEVRDEEGVLRPEMYVNVVIRAGLGRKLAVPEEAVLDTGERRLVFVKTGPGRYDPREVSIGREAEDHLEVLDGLEEGEEVVTSANFLIDSESKLKSALGAPEAKGHSH